MVEDMKNILNHLLLEEKLVKNIIEIYKKNNDSYLIKNIENSCILELNDDFYKKFLKKEKITVKKLLKNKFFIKKNNIKKLSFFILITTACNLKCPYCFESHIKNNISMNDYSNKKIMDLIEYNILNERYDLLDITFSGGEPLVNESFFEKLVIEINLIVKKYNIPVKYFLITNGTIISDNVLRIIKRNNINVQITLDGAKKTHDLSRISKINEPTFEIIMSNIQKLISLNNNNDFKITIRVNIVSKDINDFTNVYDFLYNKFLKKYTCVKVYFDFLDVPKTDSLYYSDSEKEQFLCKLYKYMYLISSYIPPYFTLGANCMIKNNCSVTIAPSGDTFKCFSLVDIKKYKNVNVIDNPKTLVKNISPLVEYCPNNECVYYSICFGGCPFHQFMINGDRELALDCHFNLIDKVNKYIFCLELTKFNIVKLDKAEGEIKHVQTIVFDI